MTALWFISALYAVQIPKDGSFKPFFRDFRHRYNAYFLECKHGANGRRKDLHNPRKKLAPKQSHFALTALHFKAFSLVQ